MTSKRELMQKVFHNEPAERVPVGFWFHFLTDDQLNSAVAHPELMEKSYAGHKAYIEAFDPDFVKIMTDGLFCRPANTMPAVFTAKDLYDIKPLPHDHVYFKMCVELAKTVRTYTGDDRMMFYNIFSPLFNLSRYLNDSSELFTVYDLMQQDSDAVKYALDVIGDDMAYLAKLVMTEGTADGIYFSVNNCQRVIPLAQYEKYVTPSEVKVLEAANELGEYQILHICGYHGAQNYLAAYRNYPAAVFNWAVHVEGVSLTEGKAMFGGKPIIGGFDQMPGGLINIGNKEDIQKFTEGLLEETGNVGIVVGADCTVPSDTPLCHLEWVREKVNELTAK